MIFGKLEFNMEIIFFDYLVFLMVTTLLFLTTHSKKTQKIPRKEIKIDEQRKKDYFIRRRII